jgi:GST-like protein
LPHSGGFGFMAGRLSGSALLDRSIPGGTDVLADLSEFPITRRWPARHPHRLQLYSLPTANGVKVSIMLEETGLPYEAHRVETSRQETRTPEFLSLNPDGKIPVILDPDGPDGQPLALCESGAILLYLAEKTGKLLSPHPAERIETIQWVFFQMAGIGPMFAQFGFFHAFEGKDYDDKRPLERYRTEVQRLLMVLEKRLGGRSWIMGEAYSIADVSLLGWVRHLVGFYRAGDLVGYDGLKNVPPWLERGFARPAVQRGLGIPARAQ